MELKIFVRDEDGNEKEIKDLCWFKDNEKHTFRLETVCPNCKKAGWTESVCIACGIHFGG